MPPGTLRTARLDLFPLTLTLVEADLARTMPRSSLPTLALAFGLVAACSRTGLATRPRPGACASADSSATSRPPPPTVSGEYGPYVVVSDDLALLEGVAARCDGTMLFRYASADLPARPLPSRVISPDGATIALADDAVLDAAGTLHGFAALLGDARAGGARLVSLDPLGHRDARGPFATFPDGGAYGVATHPAGTVAVAVRPASEVSLHVFAPDEPALVVPRPDRGAPYGAGHFAPVASPHGYLAVDRVYADRDARPFDREPSTLQLHWFREDGVHLAGALAIPGWTGHVATLDRGRDVLLVGVGPAGVLRARAVDYDGSASGPPLDLGSADNYGEPDWRLEVTAARAPDAAVFAWSNAYSRYPTDHDMVHAVRVTDAGAVSATRVLDHVTPPWALRAAYAARVPGGTAVVWTRYRIDREYSSVEAVEVRMARLPDDAW